MFKFKVKERNSIICLIKMHLHNEWMNQTAQANTVYIMYGKITLTLATVNTWATGKNIN